MDVHGGINTSRGDYVGDPLLAATLLVGRHT